MKVIRVFPRQTEATPNDELVYINETPPMFLFEADEVHISVAFTYDISRAEWLYKQWEITGIPVKMGGPAFGKPDGDFEPGMYLKQGFTITSRGCPNNCWFCGVAKRYNGKVIPVPIKEGWIVTDDNLLACPEDHIRNVFKMLARQPERPVFKGGLEAKIMKPWHVELIRQVKTKILYCAYDTPDDYEPLVEAGKILRDAGITATSHTAHCYVLMGYPGDTMEAAEKRLIDTAKAGFMPYAMLWKDEQGRENKVWRRFQREWIRPQIVGTKVTPILHAIDKAV